MILFLELYIQQVMLQQDIKLIFQYDISRKITYMLNKLKKFCEETFVSNRRTDPARSYIVAVSLKLRPNQNPAGIREVLVE